MNGTTRHYQEAHSVTVSATAWK